MSAKAGKAAAIALAGGIVLAAGCAPSRPPVSPQPSGPSPQAPATMKRYPPSDLRVEYVSHGIALSWQTNRPAGEPIAGYNIYLSPETSLHGLSAASPEVIKCQWLGTTYPGDIDPRTDIERAEINDLDYGVKYFVHVRTVYADEAVGPPSEEVAVIPRPFGRIRLVPRFRGEGDGFSFAAQMYVDTQSERNDLYLFVRNDSVFAASPHRLDRYMRYTEFFSVGLSASIDDYPRWAIPGKGETSLHLQVSRTYILATPELCLAKFRVAEIKGSGEGVAVMVDYVYQPRCGEGVF